MSQYLLDLLYSLETCLTCFQEPKFKINGRKFKILKLIGEGGFSYVYLVESETHERFALKKIQCPFGAESIQNGLREIDAYKQFRDCDYVINMVDSAVVQERQDGSKTIYILLPFYKNGNLQDKMEDKSIDNGSFEEYSLLKLFHEIALGLKSIHEAKIKTYGMSVDMIDDTDDSEVRLLQNQGEGASSSGTQLDTLEHYAHFDIKPANIMLDSQSRPIIMDLGSCKKARMHLQTRQQALELQDFAAENCTLPYRAPELFDVKTDSTVDERVDVWSFGCTLFACMYLISPFELQSSESGASLNMAICSGQYKFPNSPEYSEDLKGIVRKCLTVDPSQRPFIQEIIQDLETLLN